MKPRAQWGARWGWLFGLWAAAVSAALALITIMALRLERAEICAQAAAAQHDRAGAALWQMDYWLSPFLTQEAARPYYEYQPYYRENRAFDAMLNSIEAPVLQQSPLLEFRWPPIPLHFHMDEQGGLGSPQIPQSNERDLAMVTCSATVTPSVLSEKEQLLERVRALFAAHDPRPALAAAEARARQWESPPPPPAAAPSAKTSPEQDFAWRAQTVAKLQLGANYEDAGAARPAAGPSAGPLLPLWLGGELLFLRRVRLPAGDALQGFLVDWPALRGLLLAQAPDLPAGAALEPSSAETGYRLTSIPARLWVEFPAAAAALFTPMRGALLLVWLVTVLALVSAASSLRASFALGEKRSNFASAVTHELRTPLTTFRMYSEMLADGMVTEPAQRQEYLRTLHQESERLSRLVENVLTYSRVEQGRVVLDTQPVALEDLVQRALPRLRQRAEPCGMRLQVGPMNGMVRADPEVVAQVLFNLVDNACKYANGGGQRLIELSSEPRAGQVALHVRDHGPGVSAAAAQRLFTPFERGDRRPGDTIPGLGIGLALSRDLARAMGGDLRLTPCTGAGACFTMYLGSDRT